MFFFLLILFTLILLIIFLLITVIIMLEKITIIMVPVVNITLGVIIIVLHRLAEMKPNPQKSGRPACSKLIPGHLLL